MQAADRHQVGDPGVAEQVPVVALDRPLVADRERGENSGGAPVGDVRVGRVPDPLAQPLDRIAGRFVEQLRRWRVAHVSGRAQRRVLVQAAVPAEGDARRQLRCIVAPRFGIDLEAKAQPAGPLLRQAGDDAGDDEVEPGRERVVEAQRRQPAGAGEPGEQRSHATSRGRCSHRRKCRGERGVRFASDRRAP
ncbi:MAG: hypothetical protein ACXWJ3_18590, partial [Caldimonas sp.]